MYCQIIRRMNFVRWDNTTIRRIIMFQRTNKFYIVVEFPKKYLKKNLFWLKVFRITFLTFSLCVSNYIIYFHFLSTDICIYAMHLKILDKIFFTFENSNNRKKLNVVLFYIRIYFSIKLNDFSDLKWNTHVKQFKIL